ncbi:hypothetical protein POJ06DRAFT_244298 [Lipomyces tetrasporus]|uniref:NAD-dependent epimerase/dehydratase domain-containing protein n=1 Tax=Lipomyces tetrasporus TaxID=54092 RepID=A0AAD7QZI7_9ASCO|nr:uncharacterized protein POJ06DRAFT_244298 [Lipomyces tetrasporus]KAJ8104353.1 hypothetical protein POJ06DRAFT_244298 [Lipomyces tetrasporus]
MIPHPSVSQQNLYKSSTPRPQRASQKTQNRNEMTVATNVLITGAAGFIGQLVARELLSDPKYKVTLTDVIEPPVPAGALYPENATVIKTDLLKAASTVVDKSLDAVYIFHGIMSSGSEENFELGITVNVDATRALLDVVRQTAPGIRVVYASSQAVYGLPVPDVVDEHVVPTPQSSYGFEKLICEQLINDYTRRGFIDGFSLRFPTISVRPGKPTAAASSFVSGMIREPMSGIECVIPVQDRSFVSWICSPRTLVANLLYALTMPSDVLPKHIRFANLPGIGVSVQEMMDALEKVAGSATLKLLKEEDVPEVRTILYSWPQKFDNARAYKMGFKPDQPFEETVRDYQKLLAKSKAKGINGYTA